MIKIKRRYKILISIILLALIGAFIMYLTMDKRIYYLSLGDSLAKGQLPNYIMGKGYSDYVSEYLKDKNNLKYYINDFSKSGYRSTDLLRDINENKTIKLENKQIPIKYALIKADLVTLSIGANDLFYKLNIKNKLENNGFNDLYNYVDEVIIDIDKLLFELRKNCKEEIMVFGFYNPFTNYSKALSKTVEPIILYANMKMKKIVNKYDMTYIETYNKFLANSNYLPNNLEIHPTTIGYKAMAKMIIELLNKKNLQNN